FFSSRRRHTRFSRDWSSDVCSSDLVYDATMTLVAAMQKADSADPKKYLPELAKIEHEGVTGKISFDNKGDIKGGNLTIFTYKGRSEERRVGKGWRRRWRAL